LARSAGAEVVGSVAQKLDRPTNTYVGKGKLTEIQSMLVDLGATVVILDDELTPNQQRNIEQVLKTKVIDRSALILDVFARRASTKEGRLQVELAQHEYLLPRLVGQWEHLERLGGGIGTRGPGETQLETDRRLIRNRIQKLKRELSQVRKQRSLYRNRRRRQGMPVVSLVGYTNAGKSTLLNALAKTDVVAEGKMFSTLDPVTKRISVDGRTSFLLTDTVGFIQKIPAGLVAAFRATLEELKESDLILHVIDITHQNAPEQEQVVNDILINLGLDGIPKIPVLNKMDMLPDAGHELEKINAKVPRKYKSVPISSTNGWGLDQLMRSISYIVHPEGSPSQGEFIDVTL